VIGRTIAHYRVTEKLGEGAMGEVYRARDSRLDRDVAIKVLPGGLASDEHVMSRFRREAQVLASLNHANIGHIYGIEDAGETQALVLELIEGPTLADRIAEGPLPRERALRIGLQIAAALETAHERGIIHRDLKPGNVKLTAEGEAKVLDFGLAKGMRLDGEEHLTTEGMVLGTPAYMSPEQTNGRELDRRTDIWSFGCVLFEMLAGRPAFAGDSIGGLFAAIDRAEVDLSEISSAPPRVRRLIERCLRRDPRRRLRDIGDARVELEEVLHGPEEPDEEAAPPATFAWPRRSMISGVLGIAVGLLLGLVLFRGEPASAPATATDSLPARYSVATPPSVIVDSRTGLASPLAVSPDGRRIAFTAVEAEDVNLPRLYVRDSDGPRASALRGTEGAEGPFFSPDGEWVGFVAKGGGSVQRIHLARGDVEPVLDTPVVRGADWGPGDAIVFGKADQGLWRVPASGGAEFRLTTPGPNEIDHRWPQFLPDGESLLFTAHTEDERFEGRILTLATGEVTPISIDGKSLRHLRGHLVFTSESDLLAVRFDLERRQIVGEEVRVVKGIHVEAERGNPHVAVSESGVLVYEPRRPPQAGKRLLWVDRDGNPSPLAEGKGFEFPRISPRGDRIAVAIHSPNATHAIWTVDAVTGDLTEVTRSGNFVQPVWGPDGDRLGHGSFGSDMHRLRLPDGVPERLLERPGFQYILSWVREDLVLFMEFRSEETGWDVLKLDPTTGEVAPLLEEAHHEYSGTLSPGERWLAYVSNETGRREIFAQTWPEPRRKVRLSHRGGTEPVWSRRGDELFFRNGPEVLSVAVPSEPTGPFGEPRRLFRGTYIPGFEHRPNYDYDAENRRFVMIDGGLGLTTGRLDVFLNFGDHLERR
jgi:serine/threonine-protein kinase